MVARPGRNGRAEPSLQLAFSIYLRSPLRKVPRLVKHVIPVAAHAIAAEERWEAQSFRNFVLIDAILTACGLANDELADLAMVIMHRTKEGYQTYLDLRVRNCGPTYARVP